MTLTFGQGKAVFHFYPVHTVEFLGAGFPVPFTHGELLISLLSNGVNSVPDSSMYRKSGLAQRPVDPADHFILSQQCHGFELVGT